MVVLFVQYKNGDIESFDINDFVDGISVIEACEAIKAIDPNAEIKAQVLDLI